MLEQSAEPYKLNIFISAGESSGDHHAADVLKALQNALPLGASLQAWGMGGKKLQALGLDLVQDSTDLGVIGIVEILKKLFFFLNLEKRLIAEIVQRKPQIALLVDYPGLNLRLAEKIKQKLPSCKVVFYVAPQVWAWNKQRLHKIPKLVDYLFPILPFEEALHNEAGTRTSFVGNPSANVISKLAANFNSQEYLSSIGLNPNFPVIGLFPGSRPRTTGFVLPTMLGGLKILKRVFPKLQFVLVKSTTANNQQIQSIIKKIGIKDAQLKVLEHDHNHKVMLASTICWLASGTVSLEAACAGVPCIIGNRETWLNFLMFKNAIKINLPGFKDQMVIGLPNLIAGEMLVPEILQEQCIPQTWADISFKWLSKPHEMQSLKQSLKTKILDKLHPEQDPAEEIAKRIWDIIV